MWPRASRRPFAGSSAELPMRRSVLAICAHLDPDQPAAAKQTQFRRTQKHQRHRPRPTAPTDVASRSGRRPRHPLPQPRSRQGTPRPAPPATVPQTQVRGLPSPQCPLQSSDVRNAVAQALSLPGRDSSRSRPTRRGETNPIPPNPKASTATPKANDPNRCGARPLAGRGGVPVALSPNLAAGKKRRGQLPRQRCPERK